jgi:hypothetical protein
LTRSIREIAHDQMSQLSFPSLHPPSRPILRPLPDWVGPPLETVAGPFRASEGLLRKIWTVFQPRTPATGSTVTEPLMTESTRGKVELSERGPPCFHPGKSRGPETFYHVHQTGIEQRIMYIRPGSSRGYKPVQSRG